MENQNSKVKTQANLEALETQVTLATLDTLGTKKNIL